MIAPDLDPWAVWGLGFFSGAVTIAVLMVGPEALGESLTMIFRRTAAILAWPARALPRRRRRHGRHRELA